MYRALAIGFLLLSCSKGGGLPAKQPDGGYRLSCRGPLTDCLIGADRICRDQGYRVTEARDARELLGHEQGQSQIEIRKSDAIVYCGASTPPAERAIIEVRSERPQGSNRAAPESVERPVAPAARACVPGSTQACVGPGACSGGQACSADGSHFESCDCGKPLDNAQPTTE